VNPSRHSRQTTILTAAYLLITALLVVLFGRTIPGWPWLVAAHAAASAGLLAIRRLVRRRTT
jgi:hypothetical protein